MRLSSKFLGSDQKHINICTIFQIFLVTAIIAVVVAEPQHKDHEHKHAISSQSIKQHHGKAIEKHVEYYVR